jgi:indole-3-glycerol phosphate synthase
MSSIPDILNEIVAHKREEISAAKVALPLDRLKDQLAQVDETPRGFLRALRATAESDLTAIIAEVKKGSPSKGIIRADFDPLSIANIYQEGGAICLSVLTDERFFMGHLLYLSQIRKVVSLPLLRKDFICDPYQITEARVAGADAVLLIAAMLEKDQLIELSQRASELHLDVLLEVHDEQDLEKALATDCELIGVNNRNLRTFATDLATTERLLPLIPENYFVVSESGVTCRADVLRLQNAGANGFLVGESLMREENIGAKLMELQGDS